MGCEEAGRHPVEARIDARLHRPVLGSRQMMIVERVPHDDVLVVERAVSGSTAAGRRRPHAGWDTSPPDKARRGKLRRPEMLEHEAGALADRRMRIEERQRIHAGHQLVGRPARRGRSLTPWIDHPPVARRRQVHDCAAPRARSERRLDDRDRIAVDIAFAHRRPRQN